MTPMAEKMSALTEVAIEDCRNALASSIAHVIAKEFGDEDVATSKRHAHNMMVAVMVDLFASALEGVLDGDTPQNVVMATDKLVNHIVGPRLVRLHKLAKSY